MTDERSRYLRDPDPEGDAREARRVAREQAHQAATGTTEVPPRITRDDLKGMSAADIVAAKKAGELDHLLKGDDR